MYTEEATVPRINETPCADSGACADCGTLLESATCDSTAGTAAAVPVAGDDKRSNPYLSETIRLDTLPPAY